MALVSKWPVTRKQLSVRTNGVKFGIHVILGSFDLLVSNGLLLDSSWPTSDIFDSGVIVDHILHIGFYL